MCVCVLVIILMSNVSEQLNQCIGDEILIKIVFSYEKWEFYNLFSIKMLTVSLKAIILWFKSQCKNCTEVTFLHLSVLLQWIFTTFKFKGSF